MRDISASVRYLGFQALSNGGRRLNFCFTRPDRSQQMISVEARQDLFSGPGRMAIQECASICYETLKSRVSSASEAFPRSIKLTADDIAQHRKPAKSPGRR
jgi:hypothetical protein